MVSGWQWATDFLLGSGPLIGATRLRSDHSCQTGAFDLAQTRLKAIWLPSTAGKGETGHLDRYGRRNPLPFEKSLRIFNTHLVDGLRPGPLFCGAKEGGTLGQTGPSAGWLTWW